MSSLKALMSNYAQTSANASQSRKPAEDNDEDASRKRPKHHQSFEETYQGRFLSFKGNIERVKELVEQGG